MFAEVVADVASELVEPLSRTWLMILSNCLSISSCFLFKMAILSENFRGLGLLLSETVVVDILAQVCYAILNLLSGNVSCWIFCSLNVVRRTIDVTFSYIVTFVGLSVSIQMYRESYHVHN